MAAEAEEPIERWAAKRRVALVISILKGETSVVEAARQHGLTVAEVEEWREKCLLGAENALRTRPKDEDAIMKDEQSKQLKQKIGESGPRQRHRTGGVATVYAGAERQHRTVLSQSQGSVCRAPYVPDR